MPEPEICGAYRLVLRDLLKAVEEVKKDYGLEVAKAIAEDIETVATRAYHLGCITYGELEGYRLLPERLK
jgi:hypothetical protein